VIERNYQEEGRQHDMKKRRDPGLEPRVRTGHGEPDCDPPKGECHVDGARPGEPKSNTATRNEAIRLHAPRDAHHHHQDQELEGKQQPIRQAASLERLERREKRLRHPALDGLTQHAGGK